MTDLLLTARARQIITEVAGRFHVTPQELDSSSKELIYTRPRQVAMYVLRKGLHLSLPMIGRLLHRDHSTVSHGIGVVEANPSLRQKAWDVLNTMPGMPPQADLSDQALSAFLEELDRSIVTARAIQRAMGGVAVSA